MYHPAVALYKGSMRTVLLEDFSNLKKFLEGELVPTMVDDTVSTIIAEKEKMKVSASEVRKKEDAHKAQVGMNI